MHVCLKCLLICVTLNFVLGKSKESSNELKSVILFFRHGDRTALETYYDDPNIFYWVKYGLGRLTDKGEQRMRHLGQFLRKRYDSIWPAKENLYIRSSREDRCVESVKHLITGAYNEDFLSNPVKIYNIPIQDDVMLSTASLCPGFDEEFVRVLTLPENQQWVKAYTPLLKLFMEKYSSQCVQCILSAYRFTDNFVLIKEFNLTKPNWVNDTIIRQINDYSNRLFNEYRRTILQRRLRGGLFLKDLQDQMDLIANSKKFYNVRIYSSSQLQVAEIVSALGVFNNEPPPFGSTIMFELYENNYDGMNFVRVYYLNDTYSERPHLLKIENCIDDEFCSFQKLKLQIEKHIPTDWRNECGLPQITNKYNP
ncbi:Testicular acid phosphatase-like protein [Leptotrombidium deliense]|uniref:Testicular acid phosphatase-like protein n=1 Tax=Leptotrombidium deliense TaxID=299467 RepID=A0A443S690_9ACAR|nr:Testicular acid phosphatase-like protein [Leptotrombidium deliense]